MSEITMRSTSDTPEAVAQAMGDVVKEVEAKESDEVAEVEQAAEESADDTKEALDTSEDKEKEGDKKKKEGGFKKKLRKKDEKISKLEMELQIMRVNSQNNQKPVETKVEALKPELTGRPNANNYATADEYQEALTDWKVEQKLAAIQVKAQQEKIKQEFESTVQRFSKSVAELKKTHDDYDDVIEAVSDIPITQVMRQAILESEHSAELSYELSKDRDELKRIASLGAVAAAKAIGRFEAKLSKSSTKEETKPKSTVPAPVKPVRAKGATPSLEYSDDMSFADYEAKRNAEIKARRASN